MEPTEIGVEAARKQLGVLVTAAARDGQVTIITKGGIPAAALIPLSMLTTTTDAERPERR